MCRSANASPGRALVHLGDLGSARAERAAAKEIAEALQVEPESEMAQAIEELDRVIADVVPS